MKQLVLMLEGDGDDQYLTADTLFRLGLDIPIRFFSDSIELFSFLEEGDKPSLILVDYNSHPSNAPEVLKQLKLDSRYAGIPTVVLSDSDHARYRDECYRLGASSFIRKPDTIEGTTRKIASFFEYWFEVVGV